MSAYDIVMQGLEEPPSPAFQEAMRPELQRRLLTWEAQDWERLLQAWPQHDAVWIGQLCDTLSPSKHGQPALTVLMAIALHGPWDAAQLAAEKLAASHALNATERALIHARLAAQDVTQLGHHAAVKHAALLQSLSAENIAPPVAEAAEAAMHNRAAIAASLFAACYYCQAVFAASLVSEFADGGKTALCPFCGTDAVLASTSGYDFSPIALQALNEFWFI